MKILSYTLLAVLLFALSCITPYNPDTQTLDQKLIVDGLVTDQPGRSLVTLSLTADYTLGSLNYFATKATVYVTDNTNKRTDYKETSVGVYQPADATWKGDPGSSYTLFVTTSDGRQFQSTPQLLNPVAPIDTVYYEYTKKPIVGTQTTNKGFDLYADTRDPATPGNFYRWSWTHFEPLVFCRTQDVTTRGVTTSFGYYCCETCWDIVRCYSCNNVASDSRINGNKISRQPIARVPFTSTERYYIEVEQQSLSAEAYAYWNTVAQLTQNNGGIFDATPVPLQGNIRCTNRNSEPAFGFFGASGVSVKALFVNRSTPSDLPDALLLPTALPPPATCAKCVESAYRTQKAPRFWKF
jgi:hypothetical protein